MSTRLLRGLAFAAGMVIVRLVQGTLINQYPTKAGMISLVLVVLFGIAAFVWGLLDGRADANANPDPDRRRDLAMRWLLAGLVAGVVAGAVAWAISLFYQNVYVEGLISEVTTFAAFTALVVFTPAIAAVAIGRWMVDRGRPDEPRRRFGEARDVFDAAQEDDRTGPISGLGAGGADPEEQTSAIAPRAS
ncbi:B-4DMT family transporter [Candidatus Mycolicibacterium alkanivorans]|uniref:B-4DMT family transporter n=1 Tax=Candidatus Mycolicibacterium alkanivorans TaxID=2954114 RepID=A0ABS9YY16_9MYCO|nr:B-4DMT family transporter [Candidatus Mycolicibacterium alkanivorans]MCI4676146.1 B-4DMT family transporter [Candidatus Mycolicibacterium alkanivorans]